MEHRNLTLKIEADFYREVKIVAAKQDTSISALVSRKLKEVVEEASGFSAARDKALAYLAELGTEGSVAWSRDDLHER